MTESHPGADAPDHDPTVTPLNDVLETLNTHPVSSEAAGAIGAVAAAAESSQDETGPANPDVTHERPKPEHWDELMEFASTLPVIEETDDEGVSYYHEASVDALRAKLMELLDNESLDECRYYSVGEMLQGLMAGIQDPDRRASSVSNAATRFFAAWRLGGQPITPSIMPVDINGAIGSSPFAPLIRNFTNALPPHMRLLYDVLDWHVAEREAAQGHGEPVATFTYLSKRAGRYEEGDGMRRVGEVTVAATSRVLRRVLQLRAAYLKGKDPDFPAQPSAQQIIDRTDMDDINLIPVAQRAAAVRLDELRMLETELLGLDEHGRAVFHGKKLPKARDLAPPVPDALNRTMLHTRRLRCPALFVEGLIPGMMSCVIDAIKIADAMATATYRDMHRDWLDPDQ
jgi:hypothetical protein